MFSLGTQEYDRVSPTRSKTARERGTSRVLSLTSPIFQRNDFARKWLAKQRWGRLGKNVQACPKCGAIDNHYWLASRAVWKCRSKTCHSHFSVTTGTKFHCTALEPKQIALLLFHWQEIAEGISSRTLAGLFKLNYRAMQVQVLKLREALLDTVDTSPLTGTVEADAAYFNRYRRPPNKGTGASAHQKDADKSAGELEKEEEEKYKRNPNTHALLAFVQRRENGGIARVRVSVVKTENQVDLMKYAAEFIAPGAEVLTDDHGSYNLLEAIVDSHTQVKHKVAFMDAEGNHTNNVECFFGELRRAQAGAFHSMGLGYLQYYAAEIAWRLEMRDVPNDVRLEDLTRRALCSGPSKQFADMWNKRPVDKRVAKPEERGVAFEIPRRSMKDGARKPVPGTNPPRRRKGRMPATTPRSPAPATPATPAGSADAKAAPAD